MNHLVENQKIIGTTSTLKKLYPEIITVGIIIIGALCFPLVSKGLSYAPPFLFSGLRTLIAGISILLILPLLAQPVLPPKGTWKWILLFSIPAVVISYGTMFLSHGKPDMTIISVLENLQPLLSVFLAIIFLKEKLSPATRSVMVFGIIGVAIMSVPALTGGSMFSWSSAVLALLASLSAAVTSILVKKIKRPDAIITISAWQFIVGSIPLLLLSSLFEKNSSPQFTLLFITILLFLAIIGTALTSAVWYVLIQKVAVSRLSILFFLLPVFGLILSKTVYRLPINLLEWVGMVTIIIGAVIGLKKQSTQQV